MKTGRRTWDCELSMIDTGFLIAGMLLCGAFFSGSDPREAEIRALSQRLYERVEWPWAMNGGTVLSMGWKAKSGFEEYGWSGYSEALLLYVLAMGSPTHPLPPAAYDSWTSSYQWENLYGVDVLFAAPLFVHQLSHAWLDLRGLRDRFLRQKGLDYFENTRRAVQVQCEYARRNPLGFVGYDRDCWGITACPGPGPAIRADATGIDRQFFGYVARGVPFGPDDGTLSPWAVAASAPFAPGEVERALARYRERFPEVLSADGLLTSFNPTFGWMCPEHLGVDQGPVALLLENLRSGLVWRFMGECPAIALGLQRAGLGR